MNYKRSLGIPNMTLLFVDTRRLTIGLLLLVLALQSCCSRGAATTPTAHVATCLQRMQAHDANGNGMLSANEFVDLMDDLTNGKIILDMGSSWRTAMHESFDVRFDNDLGGVDITTTTQTPTEEFCENIYQSLFLAFEVSIAEKLCSTAISVATALDNEISPDEFYAMVNDLSGDEEGGGDFASFQEVGITTQEVFSDFVNDTRLVEGVPLIDTTSTDLYNNSTANFLCHRVLLGVRVDSRTYRPKHVWGTVEVAALQLPVNSPTFVPTSLLQEEQELTDDEYLQCTLNMGVADTGRDDQLDDQEFVRFINRFTNNEFRGQTLEDLPRIFQNLYTSGLNDEGTIPTEGARPGATADEDQLNFLREFCTNTKFALEQWQTPSTAVPTRAPSSTLRPTSGPEPTTAPITRRPTIPDYEFFFCKLNLHLADANGDENNQLSRDEYVVFLDEQMDVEIYNGVPFSDINPLFQENFDDLAATGETIDIAGSRPNTNPTTVETEALRNICEATDRVIKIFESMSKAPTSSPVVLPTTMEPTRPTEFNECRQELRDVDTDNNNFLTEFEYTTLLVALEGQVFQGQTFDQLDPVLQEPFNTAKSPVGVVSLQGSSPADGATDEELAALRTFCTDLYDAVDSIVNPPTVSPPNQPTPTQPTISPSIKATVEDSELQNCLDILDQVDVNSNGVLETSEYIGFANELANNPTAFSTTLTQAPYIIRDNFEWIAEGAPVVDISGTDTIGQLNTIDLSKFGRLCQRTNDVVTSALDGNNQIGLLDHCFAAFTAGDGDADNVLTNSEFKVTVDYFLGMPNNGGRFDELDNAFILYFDESVGVFDAIDVTGSKPGETPSERERLLLDYLCVELQNAATDARETYSLLSRCLDAIGRANSDGDQSLTNDEYARFTYFLAGRDGSGENFSNLPQQLQSNYDGLRGSQSTLDVSGWNSETTSEDQRENLDSVCSSTNNFLALLPSLAPTVAPTMQNGALKVTIGNGFIMGNNDGIEAIRIRNADFDDLEAAYTAFVNVTVSRQLQRRRLRGRKLDVVGPALDTVEIYRLADTNCPDSFEDERARCQDAYASFDLLLSDEEGKDDIEEQYTAALRQGIIDGDLQTQLDLLNPDSRFNIIGATASDTPGGSETFSPTASPPTREGPATDDSDSGNTILFVIVGAALILLCCVGGGCVYYYTQRGRDKKPGENVERPPQGRIGEMPKDTAVLSEGDVSIYDDIVPAGTEMQLLPNSDHSNEVNFGFSGHPEEEQRQTSYSKYGKTNLATVQDETEEDTNAETFAEEEEESTVGGSGWARGPNPWGGGDSMPGDMLSTSQSDTDSEGSDELVEKTSPYRGGKEPMNLSRSKIDSGLTRTSSHNSGMGLSRSGSSPSLGRSTGHSRRSGESQQSSQSLNSSADQYDDGVANESGELEYLEEVTESEYEEEEIFEEEPEMESASDSQSSQFEEDPQFGESYSEASYLSSASEERQTQLEFREEIEALVRQVVPDEIENIDAMIDQFVGREQELIATLRNMAEQGAHITESSDEEDEDDEESYEEDEGDEDNEDDDDEGSYEEDYEEDEYTSASASQYTDASASQYENEEEESYVEGEESYAEEEISEEGGEQFPDEYNPKDDSSSSYPSDYDGDE